MKRLLLAVTLSLVCAVALGQARRGTPAREPKLRLGAPVQVGAIAVVPVVLDAPVYGGKVITLDQAIKERLVEIVEIPGQAEVNSLEVRNRADRPLLLVAGELLLGGKQDRIVAKDTIVPPRESRQVAVYCVEHGRWHGEKTSFKPAGTLVPDSVRRAATKGQSQSEVWQRVAEVNAQSRARTDTGTLQATLGDAKVSRMVDSTAAKLEAGLRKTPNTIGVICWLNGKVHSADLFAGPALFAANRGKVLRGYCADLATVPQARAVPVDTKACAQFLADIRTTRRTLAERDRSNATYNVDGVSVSGYESGFGGFGGGLPGAPAAGSARAGGGGFGHGNYRPSGRK